MFTLQKILKKFHRFVDELANQYDLIERERELLPYLLSGLVYRDIAKEIFVARKTINNHAANLYRKLKIKNRQ